LDSKLACNTAGGSHHATFDCGAGYCVFNDVAVAANYLKNKGYSKRILIIDLDVHQGNGNSEIFKNDKNVLTFSMHSASNYPAKKSKSDIDIELKDHMEDEEYLNILNKNLKELNKDKYDFVFYVAGVDIHFEDRLGKLKISDEGINKRDQIVIENFYSKGTPLCGVLGGGYNKSFEKLIELHSMLHKNCVKIF
jgi:acetoin utilization deacetylase AcuC-like enzyme